MRSRPGHFFPSSKKVIVAAANYQNTITKNRVEEKPLHLGEREVCFGDYQKLIGNENWIGNLLEQLHHQNINCLVLGRGMNNLLEMLTRAGKLHNFLT